jgi:hypothetical protein
MRGSRLVLWLVQLAVWSTTLTGEFTPDACDCRAPAGSSCIASGAGCLAADPADFPIGVLLSQYGAALPDQAETFGMLAQHRHVVVFSPTSPYLVMSLANAPASSLTVVDHRAPRIEEVRASLAANNATANLHLGLILPPGDAAAQVQELAPCRSLSEYLSLGRRSSGAAAWVGEVRVDELLTRNAPRLVVIQEAPFLEAAVVRAAARCRGDCALAVALEYDGEGAVFGAGALAALQRLSEHSAASGAPCFWHMSDWRRAPAPGPPWEHLAPHLDLVCLPQALADAAPAQTRVRWEEDVHAQLGAMLAAFAPDFVRRHAAEGQAITPVVCRGFPALCQGPPRVPRFEPRAAARLGRAPDADERAARAAAAARVQAAQFPAGGCAGARVLVFCYTNPKLAGHGAQFHALGEALAYAAAAGRALVVNDSCPWAFAERDVGPASFWPRYFEPLSACPLPAGAAARRPPTFSGGAAADTGAWAAPALLWDSAAAASALAAPPSAAAWCAADAFLGQAAGAGARRWTRRCVPPEMEAYGAAAWASVLLGEALRPGGRLRAALAAQEEAWGLSRDGARPLMVGVHAPPPPRTKWTRRVPHPVLIGHAASLSQVGVHARAGHKFIEIPPAGPRALVHALAHQLLRVLRAPVPVDPSAWQAAVAARIGRRGGAPGGAEGGAAPAPWFLVIAATEDGEALAELRAAASAMGGRVAVVRPAHARANLRVSVPMGIRAGLLDARAENEVLSAPAVETRPSCKHVMIELTQ